MTILFQTKTIRIIFKMILALPSFIMVINGGRDFEPPQKMHLSIIKKNQLIKAFWSEAV